MSEADELAEWGVAIVMKAGDKVRRWTVEVPAPNELEAIHAGHGIAWAINEGSKHAWKLLGDPTAVRVSAERSDPSKSS